MAEAAYLRHFRLLANYHLWAYERLYASIDKLSEEQYRKDVGLFFKSVHGTLNRANSISTMLISAKRGRFRPPRCRSALVRTPHAEPDTIQWSE